MQASHYISSGSTTSPKHFQANFLEKPNGEGGIKDYLAWVRDHLGTPFSISKSHKVGAAPFRASIKIISVSSNITLAKVTSTEHIVAGDSRRKASPMHFYEFHLGNLIVGAFSHVPTNMTHSDAGRAALFSQAIDYIDSHCLTHDLRPQDIATHLNISLSHLYSLFRQRGQSVSSEIWNRRLLCAHSMLHDGRHNNKSITEIGFFCRFTSLAHFSRMYKKHFAMSPSEQRKKR